MISMHFMKSSCESKIRKDFYNDKFLILNKEKIKNKIIQKDNIVNNHKNSFIIIHKVKMSRTKHHPITLWHTPRKKMYLPYFCILAISRIYM